MAKNHEISEYFWRIWLYVTQRHNFELRLQNALVSK